MNNKFLSTNNAVRRTDAQVGGMFECGDLCRPKVSISGPDCQIDLQTGCALSIGRSASNDIEISLPWVSRQHAILELHHGFFLVCDVSSNGTVLQINQEQPIELNRTRLPIPVFGDLVLKAEPSDCQLIVSALSQELGNVLDRNSDAQRG